MRKGLRRYAGLALLLGVSVAGCGAVAHSEPSQEELEAAVRKHFQRIANADETGAATVRNPINNVHINLHEVRKLECKPADTGPGHYCAYTTRMSLGASSNETASEGVAHAQAADLYLKALTGGSGVVDQNMHRFVKSRGSWELVPER